MISVDVHGATVTGPNAVDLDATIDDQEDRAARLDLPATRDRASTAARSRITASTDIDRKEFGVGGNLLGMVGPTPRLVDAAAVFTPKAGDAP